jgi:hypothetical protein
MEEKKNAYKILVEQPEGRVHLRDLGVGGRIIFKCTSKKCGVKMWTGSCEYDYSSGSVKCGEFAEQLTDYQLLSLLHRPH